MRILLTADPELEVPPKLYGGIERIIDSLARGLRQRGHEVGLVAREGSTCPVDEFFVWPGGVSQSFRMTVANSLALKSAIKKYCPDVVHSFSRLAYLLPNISAQTPKIMSYQRQPSVITTKWARRLSVDSLTFTGCSEHICMSGRVGGGVWESIPNFIELDKYEYQPFVRDDAPLVFLSRLERIKGVHNAIKIAKMAGRRLIIAGNKIEYGEGAEYWKKEISPNLGGNIEYIGAVDDVQKNKLLGNAAALVVPIEWEEPFGIVFAEALACGTPVISSQRGSLPEIIDSGIHGYLVNNSREGLDAVGRISQIDRAACRRRAESHYSLDSVIARYESVYEQRVRSRIR